MRNNAVAWWHIGCDQGRRVKGGTFVTSWRGDYEESLGEKLNSTDQQGRSVS